MKSTTAPPGPPGPRLQRALQRATLTPALVLAASALSLPARADATWHGRWEGRVEIVGAPMPLVVDLATVDGSLRAWATFPGRGLKGVVLPSARVEQGLLLLDASPLLAHFGPPRAPVQLQLTVQGSQMTGQWRQGGLQAPATLLRTGAAQPEPAPRNTPLAAALHGTWRGRYDIGGVPRQVTLTLTRDSAAMHIVGRRELHVSFDRIEQGEQFLTLVSTEMGMSLEGRWRSASGAYEATFVQGPYELPLTLHREARP
jgi:hypothetical protein